MSRSPWVLFVGLALGAAVPACGGTSASRPDESNGGTSSGGGGQGGGSNTSDCYTLVLGHATQVTFDPFYTEVELRSWIGSAFTFTYVGLVNPTIGSFELSKPENLTWNLCTECVWAIRPQTDGTEQIFMAQSGTLEVTSVEESSGKLSNVLLREVTIDAQNEPTLIDDGACILLPESDWQAAPCQVGGSCPAGFECLGWYYSTLAACVPHGEKAAGEVCSYREPSTDCAPGLACSNKCYATCDYWAAGACPTDLLCSADGRCLEPFTQVNLGDSCPDGPGWFCGDEEGRFAGECRERNGETRCERICRTEANDCAAGETCEAFVPSGPIGSCTG
jgi:hypothetical protein